MNELIQTLYFYWLIDWLLSKPVYSWYNSGKVTYYGQSYTCQIYHWTLNCNTWYQGVRHSVKSCTPWPKSLKNQTWNGEISYTKEKSWAFAETRNQSIIGKFSIKSSKFLHTKSVNSDIFATCALHVSLYDAHMRCQKFYNTEWSPEWRWLRLSWVARPYLVTEHL